MLISKQISSPLKLRARVMKDLICSDRCRPGGYLVEVIHGFTKYSREGYDNLLELATTACCRVLCTTYVLRN
jgi:hypothetical protein